MAQTEPRDVRDAEERWQLQEKSAELYESTLVPAVFDPWAVDLLERVPLASGQRVLDVASGTGIVARRAAPLVAPDGLVVGLDLNPGMLAVARTREDSIGIEWVEGDAQHLPYDSASFDVGFIQQGLQFFPDPARALRELHRVLTPGGRAGISVWLGVARNPYGEALAAALDRHIDSKVGSGMRAPFVENAPAYLEPLVRQAGFREMRVDVVRRDMYVSSLSVFIRRHLDALPFATRIAEQGEAAREAIVRDVLDALSTYKTEMGWAVPWESAVAVGRK